MAKLSPTQAAKTAGISRATLYNHIKQGKISCELDTNGRRIIDTAELIRVYGELKIEESSNGHPERSQIGQNKTPAVPETVQFLHQRVSDLEGMIEELRRDKEDLRKDKDDLLEIIKQQQTLLLPPPEPSKRGSLFSRIFRRKQNTISPNQS